MENNGEEQGWGASVGVGFVFVEVGFQQEKEKSQDDWRNMRLPSHPTMAFFFLERGKDQKEVVGSFMWGKKIGNLNGLNCKKQLFKIKKIKLLSLIL